MGGPKAAPCRQSAVYSRGSRLPRRRCGAVSRASSAARRSRSASDNFAFAIGSGITFPSKIGSTWSRGRRRYPPPHMNCTMTQPSAPFEQRTVTAAPRYSIT